MNCPKCRQEMEHIESEPDVGIVGGWVCEACDVDIAPWDVDDEP